MSKYQGIDVAIIGAVRVGHDTLRGLLRHLRQQLPELANSSAYGDPKRLLDRRLQSLRKDGQLQYQERRWSIPKVPQDRGTSSPPGLKTLRVVTYRPEKYILVNTEDGTAFAGADSAADADGASWAALSVGAPLRVLKGLADGTLRHRRAGGCPTKDPATALNRDPQCQVCRVLSALDKVGV